MISVPTDGAKLMMQKIAVELLIVADRRSCDWGHLYWRKNLQNELDGRVTRQCGVSYTIYDA